MDIVSRLSRLGLTLPAAPKPVAAYVPAVVTGNQVFVSGQLPMADGQLLATGLLGDGVAVEEAAKAARQCGLNALAVVNDAIGGDWSRFDRIVRVGVFVASSPTFTDQAKVANGVSELLVELFGEAGRHARAAVGSSSLPLNASVEVEMLVALKQLAGHFPLTGA